MLRDWFAPGGASAAPAAPAAAVGDVFAGGPQYGAAGGAPAFGGGAPAFAGSPSGGSDEAASGAAPAPAGGTRLFVFGIPAAAMVDPQRIRDFLRQHFQRFGALAQVDVTHGTSGWPSSALIEFVQHECAAACMREVDAGLPSGKIIVDGQPLVIRWWPTNAAAPALASSSDQLYASPDANGDASGGSPNDSSLQLAQQHAAQQQQQQQHQQQQQAQYRQYQMQQQNGEHNAPLLAAPPPQARAQSGYSNGDNMAYGQPSMAQLVTMNLNGSGGDAALLHSSDGSGNEA